MSATMEGQRTYTYHHAQLGEMTGLLTPDNVVQFRAIPFATIPARFKQSVLRTSLNGTNRTFTEHGPACPQNFPDRKADGGPFPNDPPTPLSDELNCLILELNIPLTTLQSPSPSSSLPVLCYIHGGGFALGRIDAQHTTAHIVSQSIQDSQPLIGVSLQYRLGALGYTHVPEPANANLALNDQRTALCWVQRFVGGFGGDKSRVTVFGESAGGMSICAHVLSRPPQEGRLFNRAVLMSGVIGPATMPVSVQDAEGRYGELLGKLGFEERGDVGLERLRGVDVQELVAASEALSAEGKMWLPVLDEAWFGEGAQDATWDRIPELIGRCEWIDEIVLGTTSFEGTTMAARYADVTPTAFLSSLTHQLGQLSASALAKTYAITPTMDQNLFLTSLLRYIGDVLFDAPTHALAQHLSTHTTIPTYRYLFPIRNPFPNQPLYQQPHHWVDIYFVFKAHLFRFPSQRLKDISTRHAQLWIEFANGKSPWGEYKYTGRGDEVLMVADEKEGWVERRVGSVEADLEWGWGRCEELVECWKGAGMEGRGFNVLDLECLGGVKKT